MIRCLLFLSLFSSNVFGQKDIDSLLEIFRSQTTLIDAPSALEEINDSLVFFLDARETKEYMTSHIQGAIHIGYSQFNPDRVKTLPKNSKLIVYCSIGYRSDEIAQKLKKSGFNNVFNLLGGIFHWSNQAFPLIDSSGQPTTTIHGYSKQWSEYLKQGTIIY